MHLTKKISTENGLYIYDTWTNAILEVDEAVFHLLLGSHPLFPAKPNMSETEREHAHNEIREAQKSGYFRKEYPTIESFGQDGFAEYLDIILAAGPDQMILNITENCNLRCKYCVYSGSYENFRVHNENSMPMSVAQSAVDWYLAHAGREKYALGFYGGEPLLAFPQIRDVVAYARSIAGDKISFSLTTNAILLNQEICDYLIKENFKITISLDGPQDIHDRYRVDRLGQGTFSRVWKAIDLLYRTNQEFFYSNVLFNAVVAPPVEMLKIHQFIEDNLKLFKGDRFLAYPLNSQPSRFTKEIIPTDERRDSLVQSRRLHALYKKNLAETAQSPEGLLSAIYNRDFVFIHKRPMTVMSKNTASHGQCIPGARKCFVNTEGTLYMCEKINNARPIGSVFTGLDKAAITSFLSEYNAFFREPCQKCWAVRLCLKCFNSIRYGDKYDTERFEEFCSSMRARLSKAFTDYCEIREVNDDAFKWAENIQLI